MDDTADAHFDMDESQLVGPSVRGGIEGEMMFDTGVASRDFANGMANAATEVRMLSGWPGQSRMSY